MRFQRKDFVRTSQRLELFWTLTGSLDVSYALALFSRLLGYFSGHAVKLDGPYAFSVPVSISLNVLGLLFLLFASITFNFPSVAPVTKDSMNYTSAAIGVIGLVSLVTWITTGRKSFTGPAAVRFMNGQPTMQNAEDSTDSTKEEPKAL